MKIEGENYRVFYDVEHSVVNFQGTLRLNGLSEYQVISDLLHGIIEGDIGDLTLNFHDLLFINSSGITMLSRFFIDARSKGNVNMTLLGNDDIPWQNKSLKNLQRLMPSLKLIL